MKLIVALLFASITLPAAPAKQFIVISDIHFNPLADPALAPQLMASEPSRWEAIFANDPNQPSQHYNEDSSWPLLSALVSGVQSVQPKPKLIVLTGDILAHKFRDHFVAVAHTNDPGAFRSFVKKSVVFIGLELEKASEGVPVVYTIGNNDEECGDYALQPDGPFLDDTAETVQSLSKLNSTALVKWDDLGSYETVNPVASHHRIISLNTTFWSRRYENSCGDKNSDPGAAVLAWLSNQLQDARKHHDKVWLVFHIPPGIDGHSSAHANQVVTMWKQTYAESFYKLLGQYRNTIELSLAGHTHLDDIRLVKADDTTSLILINPGVSPNIGQNPAFRVITVDSHGRPQDILTYYVPDLDAPKWQLEYSTRTAYGLKRIDARSYEALYSQIDQSAALDDKWKLYYSVSRPAGLSNKKTYLRSLYCATGHVDPEGYEACLKQTPQ